MASKEYTQEILQYIQQRPGLHSRQIIKGLKVPERRAYKVLLRLIRAGKIYKEGVHPDIRYVARDPGTAFNPSAATQEASRAPELQPASGSSKPPVQTKVSSADASHMAWLKEELAKATKEHWRLREELAKSKSETSKFQDLHNKALLSLKSAEASLKYLQESIEQFKKREYEKYVENRELRLEIQQMKNEKAWGKK